MTAARVLHVYKYFRPQFTGEGIFLERLAPVFAELRPAVTHEVLVTDTVGPAEPAALKGLSSVHYLSRSGRGAGQGDLIRWLATHGRRYDTVHFHTHIDRTFLGCLGLKLAGRRVLLSSTLDDSIPGLLATYRPLFRPLVRSLFNLVDRFIAISPKLFEENNRHASAERSSLVPIGIPIPTPAGEARMANRRALSIPDDAIMLVSVGGVCERKDQAFLVEQLPALLQANPKLVLVLVGPVLERDYHARIMEFVTENDLTDHVVFAGFSETPGDYYAAADLMVFASREEGFGTVMIEAMAHGLPIVARHLPGVNDSFISHGINGFLFASAEAYTEQVETLLGDGALRTTLGAAARGFVAANFNIEDIAARYLDMYRPSQP